MSTNFARTARIAAIGAAVASVAYTVSFGFVVRDAAVWAVWTSTLVLLAGSLAALVVVVGWCGALVRAGEAEGAVLGGVLGAAGALGAATHAAFDLANLANPPAGPNDAASHIDPRGFATFALTGLAMLVAAHLGRRAALLSPAVARSGLVGGAALVAVFVGRLSLLDPNSGWVAPVALAAGLVLNPLWLIGMSRALTAPTSSLSPVAAVPARPRLEAAS